MIRFNENKDISPDSIIPIENIKVLILMFSSEHDGIWPSYQNAVIMCDRLKNSDFRYSFEHMNFKYMIHMLLTNVPLIYKPAFISERKYPKECALERKNQRILLRWVDTI